ncbi:MAG: bifunctional 4-hydroxy-3-methylbut-2-enyl diphosphate reductase/30S ribosomal protein S1 [Christensenellales bacterium]|jgi:ribosomal protein S1/(E)-4-hydroxy-3-methyl-but-2-enyl pyrophosphate reductase
MQIVLAPHGGFCFGVKRALKLAEDEIGGGPVYTLGPIIHNRQVVEYLSEKGVGVIESAGEAQKGDKVVIRSHGVSPKTIRALEEKGAHIIDATCPFVSRIHQKVKEAAQEGRQVIIVGKADHPEVIGIGGWADEDAIVVSSPEQADTLGYFDKALVVAQTTIIQKLFDEVLETLRPHIRDIEVFCSICQTSAQRQMEATEIAKTCDAVVIIGGRHSANTSHLYHICSEVCPNCIMIETAKELREKAFSGARRVGIIAGASTPEWIIEEVTTNMSELENTPVLAGEEENIAPAAAEEAAQSAVEEAPAQEQAAQAEAVQEQPQAAQDADAGHMPEDAPAQETAQEPSPAADDADAGHMPDADAQAASESSEEEAEANFMEDFEKTLVQIRNGQVISGTIVHVNDSEVCVNIGYKSDGFVSKAEFSADGSVNPAEVVKPGDKIEVEVLKVNDGDGNVMLSKKSVDGKRHWRDAVAAFEEGRNIVAEVKEVVKGGIVADASSIRTFIPASQLALGYIEDMSGFVGQSLELKIIELDRSKRRIVASRKAVLQEESEQKKKEVWDNLEEGQKITGVVQRLTNFGAFVDIGGVDGLIHITDLSWGRVRHPSDVVKPGEQVEVSVLNLDRERERISLGYKQTQPQPWDNAKERYPVDAVVKGKVVRIVSFGAFVELESGLDGLVHISNIANRRIEKVEDVLKVGDEVDVMVLEVNPDAKRISLSIRATLPREEREEREEVPRQPRDRDEQPRRERNASAYERASQLRQGGGQRRERQPRSNEPTSYSEDSSVTLGDLMPGLRELFGNAQEVEETVPAAAETEVATDAAPEVAEEVAEILENDGETVGEITAEDIEKTAEADKEE